MFDLRHIHTNPDGTHVVVLPEELHPTERNGVWTVHHSHGFRQVGTAEEVVASLATYLRSEWTGQEVMLVFDVFEPNSPDYTPNDAARTIRIANVLSVEREQTKLWPSNPVSPRGPDRFLVTIQEDTNAR